MSSNPALADLLARLDAARVRLGDAAGDPDAAVAALTEINELAAAASEELERQRRAVRQARVEVTARPLSTLRALTDDVLLGCSSARPATSRLWPR